MREIPRLTKEERKRLLESMSEEEKIRLTALMLKQNRLGSVEITIDKELLPYKEKAELYMKEVDKLHGL